MTHSNIFVSHEYFENSLQPIFSAIFSRTASIEDGPFQDPAWELALIPYGIHLENVPDEYRAAVVEWDYEKFDYLRSCSILGHVDSALFGLSQSWGLTAYHE